MTEQTLAPRTAELSSLLPILRTARISAACDRWHLENRATPPLKAMAGDAEDSRLRQAVEHTTTVGKHLDAVVDELRRAIALVETCIPADGQGSQTT